MPIISIDGASAVGKTSTSAELASKYGAFHIPEVASWWERPKQEYPEWFFERQIDRWTIAQEKLKSHNLVVIDIDQFQPLWYNWAFDYTLFGGQTLEFISNYFRQLIQKRKIGFPHKYFILHTDEANLRVRKEMDVLRRRRGFEFNLQFIEPQKRYFEAINAFLPDLVCFINSENINNNVENIIRELHSTDQTNHHIYSVELFDFIIEWLHQNKACKYKKDTQHKLLGKQITEGPNFL